MKQEFNIPDHLMIHDWAFTETHYILFANRIKLDLAGNVQYCTQRDAGKACHQLENLITSLVLNEVL